MWLRAQSDASELHGSRFMGALFAAMGALANILAVARYLAFRRAILANGAVPTSPRALLAFTAGVAIVGAALSAIVLSQLL